MTRSRRLLPRLLLSLMALLLVLSAVEGVARTVSPAPADDALARQAKHALLFQKHPELGFTPRTQVAYTFWDPEWQTHVRLNSLGIRGPEPADLAPGDRRVLLLGDSFTMGLQVDEEKTVAQRLAAGLSTRQRTVVWNAGVENYGTWQAMGRAAALLDAGEHFDAIVLNFYMGNDVSDNHEHKEDARGGGRERRTERPPPRRSAGRAQGPESRPGVGPTRVKAASRRVPPSVAFSWGRLLLRRATVARQSEHQERLRREVGMWCDAPFLRDALPGTRDALDRLHSLARAHDIPLVVALLPPEWVVHPEQGEAAAASLSLKGFEPTRVPKAVQGVTPDGVTVVDLTSAMRKAAATQSLFFRFDGHWTDEGHAVVADALVTSVQELLSQAAASHE